MMASCRVKSRHLTINLPEWSSLRTAANPEKVRLSDSPS